MGDTGGMMQSAARAAGMAGILNIVVVVVCIWAAWWALQNFRLDVFLKQPRGPQARLLMILLATALGYTTARFIIDYLSWALLIKWIV